MRGLDGLPNLSRAREFDVGPPVKYDGAGSGTDDPA
jgi:hypothetical protein